jgi:hypothetical protein
MIPEDARRFIPHWLDEVECTQFRLDLEKPVQPVGYVACDLLTNLLNTRFDFEAMFGMSPEPGAKDHYFGLAGQLVLMQKAIPQPKD